MKSFINWLKISAIVTASVVVLVGCSVYASDKDKAANIKADDITSQKVSATVDNDLRETIASAFRAALPNASTDSKGNVTLGESESFKEKEFNDLLSLINNKQVARGVIEQIHESFNERTGFENWTAFKNTDAKSWDYLAVAPYMDERLFAKLVEVFNNETFTKDLNNAAALAKIAKDEKDVQAIRYLHQIFHDLDYWAFAESEGAKGGDFWGVTATAKCQDKDNTAALNAYIEKHKK